MYVSNLCSSPNIIRMISSGEMRWAGHVVRIRVTRYAYEILIETPEGKGYLGNLGVCGNIILKWVLQK